MLCLGLRGTSWAPACVRGTELGVGIQARQTTHGHPGTQEWARQLASPALTPCTPCALPCVYSHAETAMPTSCSTLLTTGMRSTTSMVAPMATCATMAPSRMATTAGWRKGHGMGGRGSRLTWKQQVVA